MKSWILKWLRIPIALVLGLLINVAFFLAVPLINALFFNREEASKKSMDVIAEVEVLVNEKPKQLEQKTIRTIVQPNTYKLNATQRESSRPSGFQMDLSLARGEGGDGVAVGSGGMENVIYEAGEVDETARLLKEIQPKYPERAKKMGVSGYVKVYLVIDVYGEVSQVRILTSEPTGYGFEEAALKAVREWKFEPAKLGSYPVSQKATKEFRFVP
ncbi:MAG TPA: TonB family protein [Fibrobacteraceae bacterium]|jgi:protein TonB|nr:TonB family protein [Fibrobacteraceae bacterium]HQB64910.1 TonB family protein [Fibrobacteraceae bacterium]